MALAVDKSDMTTYEFNVDINLDDIVQSTIKELCNPEQSQDAKTWEDELLKMQTQVKFVERKQKEINRMFSDCLSQLVNFRCALEVEQQDYEDRHQEALANLPENGGQQSVEVTIVDSDNDDVQFVQKTDPEIAIKHRGPINTCTQMEGTETESLKSQSRALLTAALSASGQQTPRTVASMRQLLSASLTKQTSVKITSETSVSQQQLQLHPLTTASIPSLLPASSDSFVKPGIQSTTASALSALQQRKPGTVGPYYTSSIANQERMEKLFLEDVNKVTVDCKVLSNRYSDVWERGVIVEIINSDKDADERKYKVKFDSKKATRMQNSRQVAFFDSLNKPVTVGTRIIALYKDDETDEAFYAGIVAEAPNGRNDLRYLVFFDDGYAQYCSSKEIHKVFYQSKNVWEDIHPDSQDFVKDYLAQYPERPMVRLHKGQTVKTEWKGKWWTAKVEQVDASLVLMFFPADKRSEWIYRGSTRLEPLYTALANAEANRNTGKMKRHNVTGPKKPVVEYTRNNSADSSPGKPDKKKSVARKSTTPSSLSQVSSTPSSTQVTPAPSHPQVSSILNTGQIWEASWMKTKNNPEDRKPSPKIQQPAAMSSNTGKGKDIASVLQDRLATSEDAGTIDLESLGTRLNHIIPLKDRIRKLIEPHSCKRDCMKDITDEELANFKGNNPLLMPIFFGWERHVAKTKPYGKRYVLYRAPCGRRLRNFEELDKYLQITDCKLAVDNFCYDVELHIHYEFIPVKTFCDIKDISYGKEYVPISCVNGIDRQYPDYVDYSNQRIPASGVRLNLDLEFLVCCDCEDNCRNRSKCACQQLTVNSSAVMNGGKPVADAGYRYRRLPEPLLSGVYECNSRCKCDSRCGNRVVQNGLTNRLQVFKTEKRGWGLRCLDDIPKGGFICIYAGQLLTDQGANEDGQQYGDEYLAELDYIEVVERQKEGYESDVEDTDAVDKDDEDEFSEDSDDEMDSDSDESFTDKPRKSKNKDEITEKSHHTRRKREQVQGKAGGKTETTPKLRESTRSSRSSKNEEGIQDKKRWMAQKSTSNIPKMSQVSKDLVLPDIDDNLPPPVLEPVSEMRRTGRSTGARYGALNPSKKEENENKSKDSGTEGQSTRDFYNDDQSCYIMDAKSMGNIGRYLNHSCFPNAFVQNVFVDTHDLRFPWIAFFAGQYISAGSELTWDYNYEVGSVPGKVLYCYCGSADCRGRLL